MFYAESLQSAKNDNCELKEKYFFVPEARSNYSFTFTAVLRRAHLLC